MTRPVVIGTRGSRLALVQAGLVRAALERRGHAVRLAVIETEGDRRAPDTAWGEGAFVAAIQQAVLDGRVDVAVHSAKDVPIERDSRLAIAAYLPRADPRDALVVRADAEARTLADLPVGWRVGTDSPRRTGFILSQRPDLAVHPLHGNVDTRLRRLDDGETDALVLACAGLERLDMDDRIAERLDPGLVPPAPGQGAIAAEVRSDDSTVFDAVAGIDDQLTRIAVEAERAFLAATGGGCRAPVGALATVRGDVVSLFAGHVEPDGSGSRFARQHGPTTDAGTMARGLVDDLRRQQPVWDSRPSGRRPRVIITRASEQSAGLADAIRDAGAEPLAVPAIAIEPVRDERVRPLVADPAAYRWVVVTSANGARAVLDCMLEDRTDPTATAWAAIGSRTAAALRRQGVEPAFMPASSDAVSLANELPLTPGDRVLVARGDLAGTRVASRLRARGAIVEDVVVYRTIEAPDASIETLRREAARGPIDAMVLTSGSTVRGIAAIARAAGIDATSIAAICIGPLTAREARRLGFRVVAVADDPDPASLATATAVALDRTLLETQ